MSKILRIGVFAAAFLIVTIPARRLLAGPEPTANIQHVLLISIDGMHSVDFINCVRGIPGVNGGDPYCPNLAALKPTGVDYLDASTSKPSDSFPGLMAIVTGGSARSVGAFYDVAYDRSLDPPMIMTGNGVAPGNCTAGAAPMGYTTEFDEGIDVDKTKLNGGAPAGTDGGVLSIDPRKLDRDPSLGCEQVYPWNFVRTNTIFGVIHAAGGYTAWSDKHPSYSSVSGPGLGDNVDDYYSPEINSIPVGLPGVKAGSVNCDPLPDQTAVAPSNAWTDSFENIRCYDQLKVNAVLNEIKGRTHNGQRQAPVPVILGMNFQVVSVGEKLIEKQKSLTGGYVDSVGTPTQSLLEEIEFADASIGKMVGELKSNGLYSSTLIVITAKHGQSPVDSSRYTGITSTGPVTTSPATILANAGCIPFSESPLNQNGIGPTEDDVSQIWLNHQCTTAEAVKMLEEQSPATNNIAGIGEIFSGRGLTQLFNAPGLPPNGDPRTPDILVTPNIGVTYSGSTKKLAEHGGFAHDDTNVMMLLSNPGFKAKTITSPVETMQVAPTILRALGLNPNDLQSVQQEGTQVLDGVFN
ncbi:MAG TPA: alkaline phosphatase family protein [Candidatus Acidoferrales bacterium]|nr:alkaline phosphatase family protein [Candidatus Acidoferrales bacterium]